MKTKILLIAFMLILGLTSFTSGQTNSSFLIIGNSSLGGYNVPFQDTAIFQSSSSCTANYAVDLNQDSIADVNFYLVRYLGGFYSYFQIFPTTFNDFSMHVDNNYVEHYQYLSATGGAIDTTRITSVIKKYSNGDTLYSTQSSLSTASTLLNYYRSSYPPCTYNNINLFAGDTANIAFEQNNGDLYYIKIYSNSFGNVVLIEVKTNSVNFAPRANINISPNPASDHLLVKIPEKLMGAPFTIYDSSGRIMKSGTLMQEEQVIEIWDLEKGMYVFKINNETQQAHHIMKI
jgi:Secretion system C-terminal sorting domain